MFPMAFLMFAVLVVSAPAVAADQEATWVRTTPGVWMLEDPLVWLVGGIVGLALFVPMIGWWSDLAGEGYSENQS